MWIICIFIGTCELVNCDRYFECFKKIFIFSIPSTFVCPTELIAFSDRAKDFAGIDCQVIGVSTDSEFSHLAWTNTPRKVCIRL